jgi:hypothetical protein
VTTSRNDPVGRTWAKLVASIVDGAASRRTTSAPYVPAAAGVAAPATAAKQMTISARERCRIAVSTAFRLDECRKLRSFG